ncbi:hypothetical protein FJV80_21440 [Mesorhizobium sp. WSM4310]|nr:hypothetical protein CK232_19160 [Mesorhizobium sp. WSM4304]PBB74349.1 hypothetical protein CK227_16900 [Mesorhizobium sp. WSM4308]TRC81534.1 hypothetical protein FJV80_21440 [Mesorhizobium sp. WSM4310]
MTLISTLDQSPAVSPKRRVLRISRTVAKVFGYCRANAWPLFVAAWFPCFLTTLCLAALALILFANPGQVPGWLLSRGFDSRTWLSAIVAAPFSAMVIAFVLDRMANAPERGRVVVRRGVERVKRYAIPGMRFELGQRILLAALLLAVIQLVCGFAVAGEHRLLAALLATRDLPLNPQDVAHWVSAMGVFNLLAGAFVLVWTYLFVGDFLWTGSFDPIGCWRALDGNRLRFLAIMFIVFAIVAILKYGLVLAGALILIPTDAASPSFLTLMLVHFGLAWPFDILHLVLSAATVGTILGAFRPPASASIRSAVPL